MGGEREYGHFGCGLWDGEMETWPSLSPDVADDGILVERTVRVDSR